MYRLLLIALLLILPGCASKSITLSEMSEAYQEKELNRLEGLHQFRLDYYLNGKTYVYLTIEIKDQYKYAQILAEDSKIIAASVIEKWDFYSPEIRRCTLFPYHTDLDVSACLKDFTTAVQAVNDPDLINALREPDEQNRQKQSGALTGTVVMATVLSPLLVPAAVLQSPLLVYDYTSVEGRKEEFTLKVGPSANLDGYVNSLDSDYVSVSGNSGTAYLESGIMNEPALAFGFEGDNLLWVQTKPRWVCGGGFMFWGLKCTVGRHDDKHW